MEARVLKLKLSTAPYIGKILASIGNEEKREAGGQGKFSVGLAARRDVASQPAT